MIYYKNILAPKKDFEIRERERQRESLVPRSHGDERIDEWIRLTALQFDREEVLGNCDLCIRCKILAYHDIIPKRVKIYI